jgi:hypothetical protein
VPDAGHVVRRGHGLVALPQAADGSVQDDVVVHDLRGDLVRVDLRGIGQGLHHGGLQGTVGDHAGG